MHSEVSVLAFVVPPLSFWTKRTSLLLNCQNQTGSEYMFSDVLWNFEELMSGFEAQHPHRCAAWTRKEGSAVMRCLAPPGASGSSVRSRQPPPQKMALCASKSRHGPRPWFWQGRVEDCWLSSFHQLKPKRSKWILIWTSLSTQGLWMLLMEWHDVFNSCTFIHIVYIYQ